MGILSPKLALGLGCNINSVGFLNILLNFDGVFLWMFVFSWIIYEWMGNSTRQRFEIRLWKILIG